MSESAISPVRFRESGALPLEVDFLRSRLTSEGGLTWIAEVDIALGLTATMAAVIPDWRTRCGRYYLPALLAQRIFQIDLWLRGPGRRRPPPHRSAAEARLQAVAGDGR